MSAKCRLTVELCILELHYKEGDFIEIEWKDIEGYEGYYQVSNTGEVRSLDRVVYKSNGVAQPRCGRVLPHKENKDGYRIARLSKDGSRRSFHVHSLVAHAFVPGYFEGAEVNHKDYNRTNNVPDNLEWVTHDENIRYTLSGGRHVSQTADYSGSNNPNYGNRKLSKIYADNPELAIEKQSRKGSKNGRAVPVKMIDRNGNEHVFSYMTECAKFMIHIGLCKQVDPYAASALVSKAAKNGLQYCGCRFEFLN